MSAQSFLHRLADSFERHAARTAIEYPDETLSYDRLARVAAGVAALLRGRGIGPGDRVALYLSEKPAFLRAHLGALWNASVPLPLNPRFTVPELTYFLRDSGASAIVFDAESRPRAEAASGTLEAEGIPAPQLLSAEAIGSAPDGDSAPAETRPDDPALLLYSSGTTGEPKGVVHTQANLAAAVTALSRCWRFTHDDVLVNVLPLFHIHGLSFATHVAWLSGATMRVGAAFHPRRTLDLLDGASVFMGVPPYYYSWLDRPEFADRARRWSRLRLATCGSAPIRPDVLPRLEAILGRPIINRYGMTESHVITSLPLDGPTPDGSVGVPLEGIEVRLVADDGSLCPRDQVGAVHVRGLNLFREYWQRPKATREAFDADGWFDTGDMGVWKDPLEGPRVAGAKRSVAPNSTAGTPPASRNWEKTISRIVPLLDRPKFDSESPKRHCFGRASSAGNEFEVDLCPSEAVAQRVAPNSTAGTPPELSLAGQSPGFLTLVGRSKDLILAGGFNVYPAVVERVLAECPGVREAAVFGLPDARRGERVAAAVVADSTSLDEKQVREFCRARLIDYQCPAAVFLVDELPRNTMGKVLRRELRERFAK